MTRRTKLAPPPPIVRYSILTTLVGGDVKVNPTMLLCHPTLHGPARRGVLPTTWKKRLQGIAVGCIALAGGWWSTEFSTRLVLVTGSRFLLSRGCSRRCNHCG